MLEARRRRRVSLVEFSRLTGISEENAIQIERGEIEPTREQARILKAFIDGQL